MHTHTHIYTPSLSTTCKCVGTMHAFHSKEPNLCSQCSKRCLLGEPQRSFCRRPLQPHHRRAPRGISACPDSQSTMPGCSLFTRGWHARATVHTCGCRGATSRFNASSVSLLGCRVGRGESSPHELPFNCLSEEEATSAKQKWKNRLGLWGCFPGF